MYLPEDEANSLLSSDMEELSDLDDPVHDQELLDMLFYKASSEQQEQITTNHTSQQMESNNAKVSLVHWYCIRGMCERH